MHSYKEISESVVRDYSSRVISQHLRDDGWQPGEHIPIQGTTKTFRVEEALSALR